MENNFSDAINIFRALLQNKKGVQLPNAFGAPPHEPRSTDGRKAAVPACAFRGPKDKQATVGNWPSSAATNIQDVKSRPKRSVSSISYAGFLVSRKPMTLTGS